MLFRSGHFRGLVLPLNGVVNLFSVYGDVRRSTIVPERNGIGAAYVLALRRLTGNLFREKVTAQGPETTEREGWFTDAVTRPLMFESLGRELREGSVQLSGERSITEVRQLVNHAGKAEAPSGGQDGLAVCHAIASHVRSLRPVRMERRSTWEPTNRPVAPLPNMGIGYAAT